MRSCSACAHTNDYKCLHVSICLCPFFFLSMRLYGRRRARSSPALTKPPVDGRRSQWTGAQWGFRGMAKPPLLPQWEIETTVDHVRVVVISYKTNDGIHKNSWSRSSWRSKLQNKRWNPQIRKTKPVLSTSIYASAPRLRTIAVRAAVSNQFKWMEILHRRSCLSEKSKQQ